MTFWVHSWSISADVAASNLVLWLDSKTGGSRLGRFRACFYEWLCLDSKTGGSRLSESR